MLNKSVLSNKKPVNKNKNIVSNRKNQVRNSINPVRNSTNLVRSSKIPVKNSRNPVGNSKSSVRNSQKLAGNLKPGSLKISTCGELFLFPGGQSFSSENDALRYWRFERAMCSSEMALGHSASHASVLEQLPNPRSSALASIFRALCLASACPWGSRAR